MNWFRSRREQNEIMNETAAGQRIESLQWAALIITGNAESAQQSIVDAGGLVHTTSFEFRDWLVRWGRSATARVAVTNARSSIHKAAAQYADCTCSHRAHQPLTPAEVQILRAVDAYAVVEQLDVLARATLVLYGCHHASLSECVLLLDVQLPCVMAAYCKALKWYHGLAETNEKIKRTESSKLFLVRYDSDGVPVWDSACPHA